MKFDVFDGTTGSTGPCLTVEARSETLARVEARKKFGGEIGQYRAVPVQDQEPVRQYRVYDVRKDDTLEDYYLVNAKSGMQAIGFSSGAVWTKDRYDQLKVSIKNAERVGWSKFEFLGVSYTVEYARRLAQALYERFEVRGDPEPVGTATWTLVVVDQPGMFRLNVYLGTLLVKSLDWQGGEFEHAGVSYCVRGPYHGLPGYQVFRLVPEPCTVEAHQWQKQK